MVDTTNFTGRAEEAHKITFSDPIEYLKGRFNENHDHNLETGFLKQMGWRYDFRPFMKRFVYKLHGSWYESYAPNKSFLRKIVFGTIDEIQELQNKHATK